jgi:hypothetical protein
MFLFRSSQVKLYSRNCPMVDNNPEGFYRFCRPQNNNGQQQAEDNGSAIYSTREINNGASGDWYASTHGTRCMKVSSPRSHVSKPIARRTAVSV